MLVQKLLTRRLLCLLLFILLLLPLGLLPCFLVHLILRSVVNLILVSHSVVRDRCSHHRLDPVGEISSHPFDADLAVRLLLGEDVYSAWDRGSGIERVGRLRGSLDENGRVDGRLGDGDNERGEKERSRSGEEDEDREEGE